MSNSTRSTLKSLLGFINTICNRLNQLGNVFGSSPANPSRPQFRQERLHYRQRNFLQFHKLSGFSYNCPLKPNKKKTELFSMFTIFLFFFFWKLITSLLSQQGSNITNDDNTSPRQLSRVNCLGRSLRLINARTQTTNCSVIGDTSESSQVSGCGGRKETRL